VIHVLDASRSVPVASEFINPETRENFKLKTKQEYAAMRKDHEGRSQLKNYISIADARVNRVKIDWDSARIVKPKFLGVKKLVNYPLEEIAEYIDWTPFFQTWMLYGRYPDILKDPKVGAEATKVYNDAKKLLKRIVDGRKLQANAVFALYEANSNGDDIVLKNAGSEEALHFLRQQNKKADGLPNFCLADFVAPAQSGKQDYVGMFAVTTGIGLEKLVEEFKSNHDDYSEIMAKALADRLAEAFAELLHAKVRKEFWGYAQDENISVDELIKEKYDGIRPAPGYPACPDHTEKATIFKLLKAEEVGITLTESFAMYPAAAVSGYYFGSTESKYFGLGKIEKDQVAEYAKRKGLSVEEIEKWLSPNLAY
jgi:5-methyltetrahydrofolate--homocysteine methyltransferase